jgi:hypothetical protein
MGAGAGTFNNTLPNPAVAASGGGVVRLSMAGTLTVDGLISANGGSVSGLGAGAGGSIWIDASAVTGNNGFITANGGAAAANSSSWGAGGGGRIAIYSCARALPASRITSDSGTGGNRGASNPVYLQTALIAQQPIRTVSCEQTDAIFNVAVIGPGPSTDQWHKGTLPLIDGITPTGTQISGADSPRPTPRGISLADDAGYDCLVSTACGGIPSTVATLQLFRPCSLADIVGTNGGPRVCGDSAVDGSDFIAFINSFSTGDPSVDELADVAGGGDDGLRPTAFLMEQTVLRPSTRSRRVVRGGGCVRRAIGGDAGARLGVHPAHRLRSVRAARAQQQRPDSFGICKKLVRHTLVPHSR